MADSSSSVELRVLPRHVPVARPGALLSLRDTKPGQRVQIIAIRLESSHRQKLYTQGFIESRHVRILHNDHRGRVMLKLDGDIFLLGRTETPRIQVREIVVR